MSDQAEASIGATKPGEPPRQLSPDVQARNESVAARRANAYSLIDGAVHEVGWQNGPLTAVMRLLGQLEEDRDAASQERVSREQIMRVVSAWHSSLPDGNLASLTDELLALIEGDR
jgi:hypothetical protein